MARTPFAVAADDPIAWHDPKDTGIEGKGWSETKRFYDRLPGKAEGVVRDAVWGLSRHSAGMCFDFETDATTISARWSLLSASLAMPHMPATGVSGLDLYAQDEKGVWRWVSVAKPSAQNNETTLISGLKPGSRRYRVYLPLYNGTESVQIGVSKDAAFKMHKPRAEKPIVFYGTSITHGACASRPGMPHPAILGRWLNRPVLNLGFSGNGKMEKEVAELLAELDPCIYVIDCLPNMDAKLVTANTEPLVKILRKARPTTPIVLVEDRSNTNAVWLPARQAHHAASRAALRKAFDHLTADGVKHLSYIEGEPLLGDDGEAATDGSHPSDLGFMRQAKHMHKALEPLLKQ
ncbi:MAG: SGNH/GDSL hydrolase family protein [Phycisphaeraceae bacterium]